MTIHRFDQIAENIRVPVLPSDTDLERYVGLEHLDSEFLKLRRWGNPSDVIGQKLRFWKGDIIYGKRRAYQRKLAVADFDGICSAHAFVLRAKPDICLPEFFPFFLQSELFHQRALEISVGSLSPTINWSTLAKQEFPLPPVDEQRHIADLLWAADDVQENLENLKRASQELYLSLSTKVLFPRYSKSDTVHQIDNLIPEDCNIDYLENLVVEDAPICYGIVQPGLSVEDGIPMLAIKDMKGNFSDGVHRTSPKIEKGFIRSRI